jgi:Ca2+-binding RTX toxin-like protein
MGLAAMAYNGYNVPVRRLLPKGLIVLVAAAGLVSLSSAQGGVFPGSNGRIAYTCGSNICTINPDGTGKNPTFLTSASDPSWSSDQSAIAYVDPASGISVANDDGSFPGPIGAASGSAQPSLSFDGSRVAYVRGGIIYTSQAFGGGELPLTTGAADADPAYSPDGTKIAFARNSGGASGFDIWTINVSTGVLHQVTNAVGDERTPTWSPSGLSIVYSAGSTHKLFGAASSTSGIPTPTDLNVTGTDPAFSPDGTLIAFINTGGHLAVMTNTTTPTVTVLDSSVTAAQPDWEAISVPTGPPPTSFTGPPVNVSYPTVNLGFGDTVPTLGDFLTASVGTWNGATPFTYTYQWKRCDPADPLNGQCIDIAGAKSSFYTPVAADYGQRLRVQVTATNSQGTASQNSESTAPVTADAPHLRVTPQIFGQNIVDQTLSIDSGTWDGSPPLAFTYSWRRCNPPGDISSCVPIAGATTNSYTATTADIGFTLRVWITGTNPAGTDVGITNHTFPVVDKQHFAPSTIEAPSVVGTLGIGRQVTGSIGTYDGDTPIATTFVWQRCNATGTSCHTIVGATKMTYHPTTIDIGSTLRLAVTAKNAFGTFVAMSDPTEPVPASPPHRKGRHIVGTSKGEYIAGGGFDDTILGMGGNDTILGGAGDDFLDGGAGNDVITGGAGADKIFGGAGSDTIYAADGERDVIDCGDGQDRAVVDSVDVVKNCEVVQVVDTSSSGSGSGSGTGTGTGTNPGPIAPPPGTNP